MVQDKEKKSPYHETITLRELGPNLPIYRLDKSGTPIKDLSFSFIEWDMEIEEELSTKFDKSENIGKFVNEMMCRMLDRFCGDDFASMKHDEKSLILHQLDWPNMMYLYFYLRIEELGSTYKFNLSCPQPRCRKLIEGFTVDLMDLDINVKRYDFEKNEPSHPRRFKYELVKPILLEDKTLITSFEFDVAKWGYMEKTDREKLNNSAGMKQAMLKSSVCGLFDGEGKKIEKFLDPAQVMRKMKKIDIEKTVNEVADNNGGPHPAVEGECPHCKQKFHKLLDWTYSSFFDSSSL